jgi:hypothetical protein
MACESNTKSKLILHVGTRKTGSSSIQGTMFRASDMNIRYVNFGKANSSNAMAALLQHDNDIENQLNKELRSLDAKTGVISAESLSTVTAQEVSTLYDAVNYSFIEPRVIAYVREPFGYFKSMFQQTLKWRAVNIDNPGKWIPGPSARKISYYKLLDSWFDVFPEGSVDLFPFERSIFPNGDVVDHFLDYCGVAYDDVPKVKTNESMPFMGLKALYIFRHLIEKRITARQSGLAVRIFQNKLSRLPTLKFAFKTEIYNRISHQCADFEPWCAGHGLTGFKRMDAQAEQANADILVDHATLMHVSTQDADLFGQWSEMSPPKGGSDADRQMFVAKCVEKVRRQ